MFRARTLCCLGLVPVAAALAWCQPPREPGPPDDGRERTTAELLVGTWVEASTDGRPRSWWNKYRFVYRPDGTYRTSSNIPLRELWLPSREGRYEVIGRVVRHHYPLTTEDEDDNRRNFPEVPSPGSWDTEVIAVVRDELTVLSPSGSGRLTIVYRRVK